MARITSCLLKTVTQKKNYACNTLAFKSTQILCVPPDGIDLVRDHIHIISQSPHDSANWYVQMFGAEIVAAKVAYGAPQIFLELGGKTLVIRGDRAGEAPTPARPIQPFANFSSHNTWGTDHFGFLYHDELRAKGVQFPVELKQGNGGHLLCYVSAPDGVSIELIQA